MKVLSTEGLTKLIDLIKSNFISSADTQATVAVDAVETSSVDTVETSVATLATVATTGSYNDLSDKPSIPAAQVNSDWNAVSGVAQILNKPTIPTATSDLTNDSGYITNAALADYSKTEDTVSVVVAGTTADKINVTKNGSTSTITVNNVANAVNATKATQDASGNVITTTYATKSELPTTTIRIWS